jgi:hypothetical protein
MSFSRKNRTAKKRNNAIARTPERGGRKTVRGGWKAKTPKSISKSKSKKFN